MQAITMGRPTVWRQCSSVSWKEKADAGSAQKARKPRHNASSDPTRRYLHAIGLSASLVMGPLRNWSICNL
jgi:hypothetical protein